MAAVYQICPCVHTGVGQVNLGLGGFIEELLAPVKGTDDIFRSLLPQLGDGLCRGFLAGHIVPVGAVYAQNEAAFRGKNLGLTVGPVRYAPVFQSIKGILGTGLTEIIHVIVCSGHKVYAAAGQYLGPFAGGTEVEGLGRVHYLIGKGTLQIGQGKIVVFKILHGI